MDIASTFKRYFTSCLEDGTEYSKCLIIIGNSKKWNSSSCNKKGRITIN